MARSFDASTPLSPTTGRTQYVAADGGDRKTREAEWKREVVRVYDEKATQKKPVVMLTCTRCNHALMFNGMSNLFDLS